MARRKRKAAIKSEPYCVKAKPFSGTRYADVAPQARALLRLIARRTKRRPYIRSAYFRNDKIFFTYFWSHISQKAWRDRARRLRYLPCAVELIQKSRNTPTTKDNPNNRNEALHRLEGITSGGQRFTVQIKENKRTGRKELMSVFPR